MHSANDGNAPIRTSGTKQKNQNQVRIDKIERSMGATNGFWLILTGELVLVAPEPLQRCARRERWQFAYKNGRKEQNNRNRFRIEKTEQNGE